MHGCGHDGHIAMLLSAAKILKNMEASLNGRVVLMFEEGEEGHRNIEKLLAYMAEKEIFPAARVLLCQAFTTSYLK